MKLSQIVQASQQLQKYTDVRHDVDLTDNVFSEVEDEEEEAEEEEPAEACPCGK